LARGLKMFIKIVSCRLKGQGAITLIMAAVTPRPLNLIVATAWQWIRRSGRVQHALRDTNKNSKVKNQK